MRFRFLLNPSDPRKIDFKFSFRGGDNEELLNYSKFMMALKNGKDIHVCLLKNGEDIIAGKVNGPFVGEFDTIEENVDLLERICTIEKYFNVTLKPGEVVTVEECNAIAMVSNLISYKEVDGTWEEADISGILDQHFREEVLAMEDEEYSLSFAGVRYVHLFGAEFKFAFLRTFQNAQIVNLEKLKQKVKVLDDGDSVKFKVKPGSNKKCIETMHIPEGMKGYCDAN